jgi:hypothetical protein
MHQSEQESTQVKEGTTVSMTLLKKYLEVRENVRVRSEFRSETKNNL